MCVILGLILVNSIEEEVPTDKNECIVGDFVPECVLCVCVCSIKDQILNQFCGKQHICGMYVYWYRKT